MEHLLPAEALCPSLEANSRPWGAPDLGLLQSPAGAPNWPSLSVPRRAEGCGWCGSASRQRARGRKEESEAGKQKIPAQRV